MKRSPLRRQSKKRAKESALYLRLRQQFLLNNPICVATLPVKCGIDSTDVHHRMGRGKYYLEEKYWMPVCRPCHDYIEGHKKEARLLGYILYK